MTQPVDTKSEEWRHECECRDWLARGFTSREKVDQLMGRISARRGLAAAKRLREGMRKEWARMQESRQKARQAADPLFPAPEDSRKHCPPEGDEAGREEQ